MMKKIKRWIYYLSAISLVIFSGCRQKNSDTFTLEDFYSVKKIDAHVHLAVTEPELAEQALRDNFHILTNNTAASDLDPIGEQRRIAVEQMTAFPEAVSFSATFNMEEWDNPDWQEKTINYLNEGLEKGAIAVKVFKNIGMIFKDKNGKYVMIDDPKFDPIFDFLTEKGISVLGHLGDSRSNWRHSKDTTVKGSDAYYNETYPGCPTFNEIIKSRDNMLAKHPDLKFIGCHLASQGHSLDELANSLDEYQNLAVDVSGRVKRFQTQSQKDREKVRNFIMKYQDRIIYGTDMILNAAIKDTDGTKEVLNMMHGIWIDDWKYFTSDEVMTSPEVEGEFVGLALPRSVVEKIFRLNAEKWYPGIK